MSGRLHQRRSNVARLTEFGLPVLSTPAELAAALGLTVPQLRWLAFHTDVATRIHYVTFTVPKRSGGTRTPSAPHRKLAAAQGWVLENILRKLPAHGFVAGRNVVTNASPHVGKAVLVNADLEDFFPSITFRRVRSVFQRLGYSPAVATVLALLCTECPRRRVEYDGTPYWVATGPRGLSQGACTSPPLSNQVARRLDKRLGGLAAKLGITYTRYADDLTFSGDATLAGRVGYLLARPAPRRGGGLHGQREEDARAAPRRPAGGDRRRRERQAEPARRGAAAARAILHRAGREGLDAQNREARPDFHAWLAGEIAYVRMVRPDLGERLLEPFRAAQRPGGSAAGRGPG